DFTYVPDLISINANVNVSDVPVPAAVWLFGSGLIGLVGMARRKTA
ncbi:MAG TPA: VPLPA-CTERM sorting domain-containing protein, partial [Chromatiaceae bacterium]|nr:VPLPA-CTERM sorting domain-containing protein [Chromatiaceae bacterium]